MMSRKTYLFILFLITSALYAQQSNEFVKAEVIDRLLESIAEQNGDNADYTNLVEALNEYFEEPLNINTATREELSSLVILDETQIMELRQYIDKHGALLSIYELQLVKGWDKETILLLLPFIQVIPQNEEKKRSFGNYLKYGKHEMLFRYNQVIEEQAGFIADSLGNTKYQGSPQQFYVRYRYSHTSKYSFGLTMKKDRGEEFFRGSNGRGFDFYSGHIFLKNMWKFKSIALGDFQMQIGQGVNFWKGFGFRKSAFSTSIIRNARGLAPYTSSNSNNYMRGAAFEFELWKLTWTSFFSIDLKDASIDSSGDESLITSISSTGFHRTLTEISKRESIREIIAGNYLQFNHKFISIGAGVYYSNYDKSFLKGSQPYDLYDFTGNYQLNGGFDYKLRIGNVFLFGELGLDKDFNYALIQGLESSVGSYHFSILYRDYSRGYNNFHSNAFGESSSTKNERGFYMGVSGSFAQKFSFRSYVDIYQFPWLRYNVDAPSWGFDGIFQLNFLPSYNTNVYIRYKFSNRGQNGQENDTYLNPIVQVNQHFVRMHAVFKVMSSVSLRSRIEATFISRPDAGFRWGILAYQDVNWQPATVPISASARFALFRTDDFDTRIYAYENDLLYNFSVPFYYDLGLRWYMNVTYRPVKGLSIGLRISQFVYPQRNSIGSGYDEIEGMTKTDIKIQLRYRFGNIYKSKRTQPSTLENEVIDD